MKIRKENVVEVQDWDELVRDTYNRPYSFQQQDGCKPRGVFRFGVPDEAEDYDRDTIPEKINGEERGVSFDAWLKRDPKQTVGECSREWEINLWWTRNFYPDMQMIANDLHEKGLLEAGDYTINIDW